MRKRTRAFCEIAAVRRLEEAIEQRVLAGRIASLDELSAQRDAYQAQLDEDLHSWEESLCQGFDPTLSYAWTGVVDAAAARVSCAAQEVALASRERDLAAERLVVAQAHVDAAERLAQDSLSRERRRQDEARLAEATDRFTRESQTNAD